MGLSDLLAIKNNRILENLVPERLRELDSTLASIEGDIDTIVTGLDSYYVKCLSTDTGALLVVASGATTGQINLVSVLPRMSTYTPVAGDYVTKMSNLFTAEQILARVSAIKNKTFGMFGDRIEELDSDTWMPMTNLVINSNFSNGTTGWSVLNTQFTVTSGVASVISDGSTLCTISQAVEFVEGHTVYIAVLSKTNNGSVYFYTSNTIGASASTNILLQMTSIESVMTRKSAIFKITATRQYLGIGRGVPTVFDIDISNVCIIDLTATFGMGNEPTQAQMDSLLSFYPDSWFDGTINFAKNTKAMPYLLNQIRQLNLEKTSYGVHSGLGVIAQTTPDMTVNVATGIIYMVNGRRFVPEANIALSVSTADAANPRIDIVYVDLSGIITYLAGTAALSPSVPSTPTGGQKIAEIYISANATQITSDMIVDTRKGLWVDNWIKPTLTGGAQIYDVTAVPQYRRDVAGRIYLRGKIKNFTIGANLFRLMTAYRPTKQVDFDSVSNNGFACGYITTDGYVVVTVGNPTWLSLDNIDFSTN